MSQYYQGPHGGFNQQFYNKMSQYSESNNSISSNQYDDIYGNNNGNNYHHGYNQSQSKQQQHQSDMIKYHNPNLYNQQYNQNPSNFSNSSYQSFTNSSNKSYVQNQNQNQNQYQSQYDQGSNYNQSIGSPRNYPQSISSPRNYNQGYNNGHNKGFFNNDQQQSQQPQHPQQQYNINNNQQYANNNMNNNNNNNNNNKNKYHVCDAEEYKTQIIPSQNTHPNQSQNQTWKQADHTTHRVHNQYHPKQAEQFTETKKAHIYNMRAHLETGILSVEVYDAIQRNQWRAEFTQNNFHNIQLYTVAKVLVDAINGLKPAKSKISVDGFKPVSIQEYNGLCYLTVNGAQIPQTTFALYPYNTV